MKEMKILQNFEVEIIEKLSKIVKVKAKNRNEAERIVSDNWRAGQYILGAEDFIDVEFFTLVDKQDAAAQA